MPDASTFEPSRAPKAFIFSMAPKAALCHHESALQKAILEKEKWMTMKSANGKVALKRRAPAPSHGTGDGA